MSTDHHSGLEEVKVLPSEITLIEGSKLFYRGVSIEELAAHSTFEDVTYLLWYGRLPGARELKKFTEELSAYYGTSGEIQQHINQLPREAHPQGVLSHLISALALHDPGANQPDAKSRRKIAIRILAQTPVLMCAYERYRKARSMIEPRKDLSFAGNCLYMLHAEEPDEVSVRALDTCLISCAEHELNASTFAARVTTGTMTDMYSAVVSGINTLKGPLHGGANQGAMEMILDIHEPESAREWLEQRLMQKSTIMGFGHRVYKKGDPRAKILKKVCEELYQKSDQSKYYQIALEVEKYMKEKKGLFPNIDFYSALVLHSLGFPIDTFTTVFSISRIAGWIAHINEQYENNRLIRPRAEYVGRKNVDYTPVDQRG